MLEQFGIYGWGDIEPVVLAAMVAKQPVLFIGTHGAAKTEGAVVLIKALSGPDAQVQKYDVPNLQAEELLGYPNPRDLAEGKPMSYVPTPISIWGKKGIILDELNRATMMVQHKLVELVREKTVMGMPTGVEYVFAAVNPPESYGSLYMELALASRFICVQVPDLSIFTEGVLNSILETTISTKETDTFVGLVEKVRRSALPKKDTRELRSLVARIAKVVHTALSVTPTTPGYNVRSMKMLYDMLDASEKLRRVSTEDYAKMVTSTTLVDIVLSTIPEIWGITQKTTQKDTLVQKIKNIVADFKLGDTVSSAVDVEDLLDSGVPTTETLAWSEDIVSKIKETNNELKLRRVRNKVVSMLDVIPVSIRNSLLLALLHRMKVLKMFTLDYPLSEEGISQLIKEAFEL